MKIGFAQINATASELNGDKQAREFVTLLDRIRSLPGEPLSMEEIQAEVDAVREARGRGDAGL